MTILRAEIVERIFDRPLLLDEAKADVIMRAIGGRLFDGGVTVIGAEAAQDLTDAASRPAMGRVGDRLGRAYDRERLTPYDVIDGVAIVPVEGTLVHKGRYVGMSSGRTSYEGLQTQLVRVARDPFVKGVAFEVDSFGGEVAGAFETAAMMAEVSALKPTMAILTDFALSAGYLLAAQARQIVIPETGRAGSIGVITMHVDYSRALDKEGVTVTVLTAGARKAEGNSFSALPAEVADRIRADLEVTRQAFAGAVARGRGSRLSAAQALDTQAGHFAGREAVRLGLADAVGDANAAFEAFRAELNARRF